MKSLRLSLAASILTAVLSTAAFAGDMPLPGVQSSQSVTAAGDMPLDITRQQLNSSQPTVMGDMPTGGAVAGAPTVTEMALALMQSALLLF